MPQSGLSSMQGSTEGCLPRKVIFQGRLSFTKGCLPPNVVFHQRSFSTEVRLPLKVVFHRRSSSISTEGRLPPRVIFHQRLSSTYHNTLVDLIFVRAVNIPNLRFLTAMHDAWCYTLVYLIFVRTVSIPNLSLLPCLEVGKICFSTNETKLTDKAINWGSMLPKKQDLVYAAKVSGLVLNKSYGKSSKFPWATGIIPFFILVF